MLQELMLTARVSMLRVQMFLTQSVEELLNTEPSEGNPTNKVNNIVKEYGAGGMNIARTVFIYALAISLFVAAILMVVHGRNRQKMPDIKDGIGWIVVGGLLGFGAVGLVVFMESIGQGLFTP